MLELTIGETRRRLLEKISAKRNPISRPCTRATIWAIGVLLLCLALAEAVLAQGSPDIVWQAEHSGKALAFSSDGRLLLSGTNLWRADGKKIRTFVLPYNGGGVNAVALSPDGQFAAIGIQAYNQNLDLFRVGD